VTVYNKIVRDLVPEVIAADGHRTIVRTLDAEAAKEALIAKLGEEGAELLAATPVDAPDELADLLEVVRALAAEYNVAWDDVIRSADEKAAERGGFDRRMFLESTEPWSCDMKRVKVQSVKASSR
jgi:predicted house-cleaning noncanonical NTP pyrophosphatase (MazG superfamily)